MNQRIQAAVWWLRQLGMDIRPWDTTQWCLVGPLPDTMDLMTSAELLLLVRALQRTFRPLIITDAAAVTSWN